MGEEGRSTGLGSEEEHRCDGEGFERVSFIQLSCRKASVRVIVVKFHVFIG